MVSPWLFAIWGMDILGPFPMAPGQKKFLLVVIDYFTKWVKAVLLTSITTQEVQKFFWKSNITCFGIPNTLLTDNDLQFIDKKFNEFLSGLGIKHRVAFVEHPQTKGQAKAANKVFLSELKKWLNGDNERWVEQLVEVLWAYRCTPQSTTQETPFWLTYDMKTMLPIEVGEVFLQRHYFAEAQN